MAPRLNLPKERIFKGPALVWKRFFAFMIDLLIIDFVIGFPFRKLLLRMVPAEEFSASYAYLVSNPSVVSLLTSVMILFGLLALLYFAVLEYRLGQTIGKMFVNIKVESGKGLTFLACLIRSMQFVLIFPFILLWIIDPLFMLFNKDGRRLSEILSGTRTVEWYSMGGE
jgi:uncharacterized RDD family membrane protein YckC